jgi:DNA-binding PadR family transcriptional regulator
MTEYRQNNCSRSKTGTGPHRRGEATERNFFNFPLYPLAIHPRRIYNRSMANNKANAPLTPAVLHILLALSAKESHGYGIMKKVQEDSQGKVKMGPGTLYGSLGRMIDAGLIRESDKKVDPHMDDQRRVYYALTSLGRKALAAELQRYDEVVALAKRKALLPNT